MEKAFYVHLQHYAPLLKEARINYKEDEKCLIVGKLMPTKGFMLYISCKTIQTPDLLKAILPYLKAAQLPFRLIKNQAQQYRLNSGVFGEDECGKVVAIYTEHDDILRTAADTLTSLTQGFKGPVIINAQQIGEIIYIQRVTQHSGQTILSLPDHRQLPILPDRQYTRKSRRNALLGGGYLPVQILRKSSKGDVIKAINLKKLAFNWCLIKQGKPVALDDHFDRDMRDRLLWQKHVIQQIQADICTPQVIDHFEHGGNTYLVTDFVDGRSFGQRVRETISGTEWRKLSEEQQRQILKWYAAVVSLIQQLHQKGYVHRDITDSNFIISDNDQVCIIDFELTCSLTNGLPEPPFLLGTFGYAAPEQLEYAIPDFKDDVYALGALLSFALSGCPPWEFLNTTPQIIKAKLERLTSDPVLVKLALACLSPIRKNRPELTTIQSILANYLTDNCHEEPATATVVY